MQEIKKKKKTKPQKIKKVIRVLQVLVGIYGILFGIAGIADHALFSIAHDWGRMNSLLVLFISVLLLISGALTIASLFSTPKTKILTHSLNLVVGLWIVVVVLLDFVGQFSSSAPFLFVTWLPTFLSHLIIITVLFLVRLERL